MKTKRSGFITCALCGSRVKTSSFVYGGLQRFVCVNDLCANSELALDMEQN